MTASRHGGSMLELDHVLCLVDDPEAAATRIRAQGLHLDAGLRHRGQGTQNRRLVLGGCYLELIWVVSPDEARNNPLRLDRRAAWAATGASPFGLAFRGLLDPSLADQFWLYDALGVRIWVHNDNEAHPNRPLVLVLEMDDEQVGRRRRQLGGGAPPGRSVVGLRSLVVSGPAEPSVPVFSGPDMRTVTGAHRIELGLDPRRAAWAVTDLLCIRG